MTQGQETLNQSTSPADACRYVTRLLVAEPFQAVAVKEAFSYFGSRFGLVIDATELQPQTPSLVRKVLRRVLGTCVLPDQLCALLYSLTGFPDAVEFPGFGGQ